MSSSSSCSSTSTYTSLYETFVMEIRPRLQSCNVFFILKPDSKNRVLVRLKENEIQISSNDKIDKITITNFRILINSLSCLQASSSYLSFRFQTQNIQKSQGQFKSELLMYNNINTFDLIKNNNIQISNDVAYTVKCANCKGILTKTLTFKRILPLPSENIDTQDWFCHQHDAANNIKLTPALSDCFYSNCYIHLNKQHFQNYTQSNSILICKRCLSWFGLNLPSDAFQIWFNTVILESKDICLHSNPLVDFKMTIRLEFKEAMFAPCKVLFECRNSVKNEYLCIWVLEKNLELYMKGEKYQSCSTNETKTVAKVLFYFSSDVDKIINDWMNDNFVSTIKISKPMMLKGLNHLYDMCKLVPKCFRTSNNFYVSYVIL